MELWQFIKVGWVMEEKSMSDQIGLFIRISFAAADKASLQIMYVPTRPSQNLDNCKVFVLWNRYTWNETSQSAMCSAAVCRSIVERSTRLFFSLYFIAVWYAYKILLLEKLKVIEAINDRLYQSYETSWASFIYISIFINFI